MNNPITSDAPQVAATATLPTLTGPREFGPDVTGTDRYVLTLADAELATEGARDRIVAAGPHSHYYEMGQPWGIPGMLTGESGSTGFPARDWVFYTLDDLARIPDPWKCRTCECDTVAVAVRNYIGDVVLNDQRIAVWCVVYRNEPGEVRWVGWPVPVESAE